ncbi:DUF547 domain-containing protein, partial [bacterium]|nr:DUF547 domain-containing protein [bacterium]
DYNTWSLDRKRAFWINAYNAFVLTVVIDNYPINNVKSLQYPSNSPKTIEGAWTDVEFDSPMDDVTLSRIEHGILPKLGNPYTIFGLCNGTKGSPELSGQVYRPETIDAQLETAATKFLGDEKNLSLSEDGGTLMISEEMRTASRTFVSRFYKSNQYARRDKYEVALMNLILKHTGDKYQDVITKNHFNIKWVERDWSLNDVL